MTLSCRSSFPKKKPELLGPLLDSVDSARKCLPKLLKEWRAELISNFRDVYHPQMNNRELEDYETDAEGEVPDESIIRHVASMNICLPVER